MLGEWEAHFLFRMSLRSKLKASFCLISWIIHFQAAYDNYDGFVILHGTDTLAYTASALSFILENLAKPVVVTGSQVPSSDKDITEEKEKRIEERRFHEFISARGWNALYKHTAGLHSQWNDNSILSSSSSYLCGIRYKVAQNTFFFAFLHYDVDCSRSLK